MRVRICTVSGTAHSGIRLLGLSSWSHIVWLMAFERRAVQWIANTELASTRPIDVAEPSPHTHTHCMTDHCSASHLGLYSNSFTSAPYTSKWSDKWQQQNSVSVDSYDIECSFFKKHCKYSITNYLLRQGGYLAQRNRTSARILSSHHAAFQRHRVNDIILGARWLWRGAANLT